MKETLFRRSVQDDRGKEKREHGSIQKETKYIGPSLRAIKPAWETLFRRSLRMTKGRGYRLAQTATLQLRKVTGSQDDKKGRESSEQAATLQRRRMTDNLRYILRGGYRLEDTAMLQLQKVTGSQDDQRDRVSSQRCSTAKRS